MSQKNPGRLVTSFLVVEESRYKTFIQVIEDLLNNGWMIISSIVTFCRRGISAELLPELCRYHYGGLLCSGGLCSLYPVGYVMDDGKMTNSKILVEDVNKAGAVGEPYDWTWGEHGDIFKAYCDRRHDVDDKNLLMEDYCTSLGVNEEGRRALKRFLTTGEMRGYDYV